MQQSDQEPLFGIANDLVTTYGRNALLKIFDPKGPPQFSTRYDRGGGDLTGPMSCRDHLKYASKGWIAVSLIQRHPEGVLAGVHDVYVDVPVASAQDAR